VDKGLFFGMYWRSKLFAVVKGQLPTDGGLVPIQQLGDLRLIMSGFHEGVNLILTTFFLLVKSVLLTNRSGILERTGTSIGGYVPSSTDQNKNTGLVSARFRLGI